MSMRIITVVTLLFATTRACAESGDLYEIPLPEIVVFNTGVFRITIPENSGITEFKFHGNVNKEIDPLRQGTINIETQKKTGGKWVLETSHTFLKKGDYICYWIFVKRDRLGYVRQPNYYQVQELVPYYATNTSTHTPPANSIPSFPDSTTKIPWFGPSDEDEINTGGLMCHNNNESVMTLHKQVESLNETVNILMKLIKKLPDAKKLTVSGRILQNENPAATVRFILWDKLDLKPSIVSAVRNTDGSITFEMETLEEKIEVLKLAKEKLINSRVTIV